ncbi:MotA/TolQ/ExbB proton channel family protein [Alienimonas californiensis]|uniref:MotA/TolQ/ExbB proton channel family protein n=1 Tax=Alienimonas californiensis TaxID=2527989 RepID=A0A517P8B8_9PLAN|nr:MotA/TolQ/ExbB proton channel family protein [Alienimonas californiensis]QDT15624.1 MotA/TolQ/ExbB proton channel family protein [Alienimonas californiensis]
MTDLLERLSELSTTVIAVACGVHLFVFWSLAVWSGGSLRKLAATLDAFTRGLKHRSVVGSTRALPDQISAFLADVGDVLDAPAGDPAAQADRAALRERIATLDESRGYLPGLSFEAAANSARTMVEAYPLLGVLGTILAIGASLQGGTDGAEVTVGAIVGRFGEAIWSTFAGLAAAILLMFVASLLEARFTRLMELRKDVRAAVARAKRELALSATPAAGSADDVSATNGARRAPTGASA